MAIDLTTLVHKQISSEEYSILEQGHRHCHRRAFSQEADAFALIQQTLVWDGYGEILEDFLRDSRFSGINIRKTASLMKYLASANVNVPNIGRPFVHLQKKIVQSHLDSLANILEQDHVKRNFFDVYLRNLSDNFADRAMLGFREHKDGPYIHETVIPSCFLNDVAINASYPFSFMNGLVAINQLAYVHATSKNQRA